jgi:hypothetical protein
MQQLYIVTDPIDRLIMAREAEELALLHKKAEMMQEEIEAHPYTTRDKLLSIACALDETYPTPLLRAIEWNTN